jgi:hypothetical protein
MPIRSYEKAAMKAKPPHAADLASAQRIARAVRFNVHLRLGPQQIVNMPCADLLEARRVRQRLIEFYGSSRKPIIYAIDPDGRTDFVPDSYIAIRPIA